MAGMVRVLLPLSVLLLQPGLLSAQGPSDADLARAAVERGEILSLADILPVIESEVGGQVLDVELDEEEDGQIVYEFEILTQDGRLLEAEVDAATGVLLDVEDEGTDDLDDAEEGGSD